MFFEALKKASFSVLIAQFPLICGRNAGEEQRAETGVESKRLVDLVGVLQVGFLRTVTVGVGPGCRIGRRQIAERVEGRSLAKDRLTVEVLRHVGMQVLVPYAAIERVLLPVESKIGARTLSHRVAGKLLF